MKIYKKIEWLTFYKDRTEIMEKEKISKQLVLNRLKEGSLRYLSIWDDEYIVDLDNFIKVSIKYLEKARIIYWR